MEMSQRSKLITQALPIMFKRMTVEATLIGKETYVISSNFGKNSQPI